MAAKAQGAIAPAPAELPLPPGFRFNPTDQDIVNYYLRRKIFLDVDDFIPEVDLYKYDPWELADKSFSPSRNDDDEGPKVEEWYLFGPRGRKYGTNGTRMKRATPKGFWKSTGKDRPVLRRRAIIGYKKTLVYHLGRAPSGKRTNWVMHEYRLHHDDMTAIQDTCALCRVFKKKAVTPPLDVPGGADANKEETKSVLDGTDADKDLMQPGAEADKDVMKSVLGGAGVVKDGIPDDACYSSINANMEDYLMPFVDDGGDANIKDYLMPSVDDGGYANMEGYWMQRGADVDTETAPMQFDPSGAAAHEDDAPMQFDPSCAAANEDDALMQFVPSCAAVDTEGAPMQFVPNVAAADEEGASKQFEPRVGAADEEGASKQFEPRVGAAADNELFKFLEDELQRFLDDEAADVELARVDDGAAGLALVSGGGEYHTETNIQ